MFTYGQIKGKENEEVILQSFHGNDMMQTERSQPAKEDNYGHTTGRSHSDSTSIMRRCMFNEEKVFVHIYNDNTNTQELYKELINLRDYNMGSISKYTDEEKYKLKNFYTCF